MRIRVAIFGGSGYGGSELLRILLFHPNAEIVLVTAHEHAGKRVSEVHKNLLGLTDLEFQRAPGDIAGLTGIDVAFFALPHGQAMDLIPRLPEGVKAIDLSGDFRIDDAAVCLKSTITFRTRRSTSKTDSSTDLPKPTVRQLARRITSPIQGVSRRPPCSLSLRW
jgi:N-acetyl-gamma-glutamylphosphate reductase